MVCSPRLLLPSQTYPCLNCDKRHVGCHATCEDYKSAKDKRLKEYQKMANCYRKEHEAQDYEAKERIKNRRRRK